MASFECHVTLKPEQRSVVELVAKKHKFKVSALIGDEVMGDDKLLYCTTHDNDFNRILTRTNALIADFPIDIKILRKKIEQIMIDERYAI